MAIDIPHKAHEREAEILHGLIQMHGPIAGNYVLFFVTGEGRFLPISTPEQEIEEMTGYVLDRGGNHYSFWFAWDEAQNAPVLRQWDIVKPNPRWEKSKAYLHARKKLGL